MGEAEKIGKDSTISQIARLVVIILFFPILPVIPYPLISLKSSISNKSNVGSIFDITRLPTATLTVSKFTINQDVIRTVEDIIKYLNITIEDTDLSTVDDISSITNSRDLPNKNML